MENTDESKRAKGRPRRYDYIEVEQPTADEPIVRITKDKYHSQYYQNHKEIKVKCPVCDKLVQKYTIGKHQRTKYCQLVKQVLEKGNVYIKNEII